MIGKTLGPYRVLGKIGAGGMGEVYRARDTRLARDVAVKILPHELLGDSERLHRFQQEAQATGQLNHPNILVVYDVGEAEGTPFVVSELLEGRTLREEMDAHRLPVRKVVDYARQLAEGLAAAHRRGIVHRDLKPANVFVTDDGRVKILDFGLAKLVAAPEDRTQLDEAATRAQTNPGTVLGTVGYMAPEQVRGEEVDARSDLFSLGTILHEMLTGRPAFHEDSSVETLNAILKSEPVEPSRENPDVSPGLDRVVQRCLEKNPEQRFQSASDLAFQIGTLSGSSTSLAGLVSTAPSSRVTSRAAGIIALVVALIVVAAGAYLWGRQGEPGTVTPSFRPLTFRQGYVQSARFTPDGESIVYTAAWQEDPLELFATQPGTPGSRALNLGPAEVLAVSSKGDLAVLLDVTTILGFMRHGTLARVPLSGGLPRRLAEDAQAADWAPDGETYAVAILDPSGTRGARLEYPPGNVLYESTGWLSSVRFSRGGDRIAFLDHPAPADNRGQAVVVDLAGNVMVASQIRGATTGLAWAPKDDDVWYSGSTGLFDNSVMALDSRGRERTVLAAPADLAIHDVSGQGRVLMTRVSQRRGIAGLGPDASTERDLSFLDWSRPSSLTSNGRWVLFDEQGAGGGPDYTAYLRGTDGSAPLRLDSGSSRDISPDGHSVLVATVAEPRKLRVLPRGAGSARTLELPGLDPFGGTWFPDGRRIMVIAQAENRGFQLYVVDAEGRVGDPITPEGIDHRFQISPDGQWVAVFLDGTIQLFPAEGGESRNVPSALADDRPLVFGEDGRTLFVVQEGGLGADVARIDLETGERRPWKRLAPRDKTGVQAVDYVRITPDGQFYVYSYRKFLSVLYLVDGITSSN